MINMELERRGKGNIGILAIKKISCAFTYKIIS